MSAVDRMAVFFAERPLTWVDGKELARQFGGYAWRTRCSDLRKRGIVIENRVRRLEGYAVSEYRYVPAETSAEPPPGHDLNVDFLLR